jgi:ATP-dependent Clp protease ATP-binding subunit ClpA
MQNDERLQKIMQLANQEGHWLDAENINSVHLLTAIFRQGGLTAAVLTGFGLATPLLRTLAARCTVKASRATMPKLPIAEEVLVIKEGATCIAKQQRASQVESLHLLRAMLRQQCDARTILVDRGMTEDNLLERYVYSKPSTPKIIPVNDFSGVYSQEPVGARYPDSFLALINAESRILVSANDEGDNKPRKSGAKPRKPKKKQ